MTGIRFPRPTTIDWQWIGLNLRALAIMAVAVWGVVGLALVAVGGGS